MGVFEVGVIGNDRLYARYLVLAESKDQAKKLAIELAKDDFAEVHVKMVRELHKPRILAITELRRVA